MRELRFYIDDSGTRSPDRRQRDPKPDIRNDWFALGGVLVKEEDEAEARELRSEFCERWGIDYPLHSSDIRFKTNDFGWLKQTHPKEQERFYSELEQMILAMPVLGLACVIDRPGYNHRYLEKYGRQRWSLCKTAFSVLVERSVKLAIKEGRRLRVLPERADPGSDAKLKGYYEALRSNGMPFERGGDAKYSPLAALDFQRTLLEFRPKFKSSPMVQIADLYLYPICRNGYRPYRPFEALSGAGKLIDCVLPDEDVGVLGIKYSCFDLVLKQA
jgi:hypothetical protein